MPIYMNVTRKNKQIIHGTSLAKGHEGWIELQSAQVGANRQIASASGRGSNREASAPSVSEIVITKLQDEASTLLFRESLRGEASTVTIDFVQEQDGVSSVYLTLTLTDALFASYSLSGAGDNQHHPVESLSLNFTKITFDAHEKSKDKSAAVETHPALQP